MLSTKLSIDSQLLDQKPKLPEPVHRNEEIITTHPPERQRGMNA